MKPSIPLSLKSLISKIHPPLPMNPRESQKLLNLLTESFRQELDLEHPDLSRRDHRPTDAHIDSLLSSPILNTPCLGSIRVRNHEKGNSGNALEGIRRSFKDPVHYFRQQVAAGQASLLTARHCLEICRQNARFKEIPTEKDSSKEATASETVLHWLWSSGLEDSLEFLHDYIFTSHLVYSLVVEGHQPQIRKWIDRLKAMVENSSVSPEGMDPSLLDAVSRLLYSFLRTQVLLNPNFDVVIKEYLNIVQLFNVPSESIRHSLLRRSGNFLASTILQQPCQVRLDSELYDGLLQSLGNWSNPHSGSYVSIHLCNPTDPNPFMALRYLKTLPRKALENLKPWPKKRLNLLCLKTASCLLARGREKDATWVLSFAQDQTTATATPKTSIGGKVTESKHSASDDVEPEGLAIA